MREVVHWRVSGAVFFFLEYDKLYFQHQVMEEHNIEHKLIKLDPNSTGENN